MKAITPILAQIETQPPLSDPNSNFLISKKS